MSRNKMCVTIEKVKDFHLDHIFDCGQCFRWNKEEDGSYTGVAGGKVVNMQFEPATVGGTCGRLTIDNTTQKEIDEFWKYYLDFETDYRVIKDELMAKDEVIGKAIAEGEGIRILNQESWETVASFIISANNNIPRIKGCIESLAENFGENLGEYRGKIRYAFPTPEKMATLTVEDLAPCRLGYRAKYLVNTAKLYLEDRKIYESLSDEQISYKEAFDKIRTLNGVGPKVANCILLFTFKKRNAFPIDVWMKKVMHELYDFDEDDIKGMSEFATEKFGENAGIAQQYLFYYMRKI